MGAAPLAPAGRRLGLASGPTLRARRGGVSFLPPASDPCGAQTVPPALGLWGAGGGRKRGHALRCRCSCSSAAVDKQKEAPSPRPLSLLGQLPKKRWLRTPSGSTQASCVVPAAAKRRAELARKVRASLGLARAPNSRPAHSTQPHAPLEILDTGGGLRLGGKPTSGRAPLIFRTATSSAPAEQRQSRRGLQ